jgi:hypothetical protein
MNYSEELRYRVTKSNYVTAVLAFAAFGAAVATYFGLSALMPGNDAEAIIVPLISALVIGAGLFGLWHKVVNIVPLLHDPAKRAAGLGVGLFLTLVTIAISSWFIATSIGGEQAVLEHMKKNVTAYESQLHRSNENAAQEVDLVPDVLRVSAELEALADVEAKVGALSGSKGEGQVVQMLRDSSFSYQRLANDMNKTDKKVQLLSQEAERLIGQLQAIINSEDGSDPQGQRRFSDIVVSLQAVLTKMNRTTILPMIKRHGILSVEYSSVSRGQRRAIENATSSMEQFTLRLSEEAQRVEKRRHKIEPLSYATINPGMATWKYADEVPAAWAVGLGVDMMPLIILLIMMIGHAEAREPYQAREPFKVVEGGKSSAA